MFKIPNIEQDQYKGKLRSDVSQGLSKIGRKAINDNPVFFKSSLIDEDGRLIKVKKNSDDENQEMDPIEQKLVRELDHLDKLMIYPNYFKYYYNN